MFPSLRSLVLLLVPAVLAGQEKSDMQQVFERLDRLEQENRVLIDEVRSLRQELASSRANTPSPGGPAANAPADQGDRATSTPQPASATGDPADTNAMQTAESAPPLAERLAVVERRIEEQAQAKVEASQKFPVTLTGMVLFNAFLNGRSTTGQEYPTAAATTNSNAVGGANLGQSVIGLLFQGPHVWGGGQVNGSLFMDLSGGTASSLGHTLRLRVATIEIDWKTRSLVFGQDKPIISPREPNSLAQVAVSPLTGAGNPWLWEPQVRLEQRLAMGDQAGLRAQVGVYETSEPTSSAGAFTSTLSGSRPAVEGRFEFWSQPWEGSRFEMAPGFHLSATHVIGESAQSRLFSIDWLIQPVSKWQLMGMFFTGQNAAGIGALRQGFTIFSTGTGDHRVVPVDTTGGWAQLSFLATKRLSFNAYAGQESNPARDLLNGEISRNFMYAGNAIYRLGPNVLVGAEVSQVRTNYVGSGNRVNNHYDLALGYLF